MPPKPTAMVDQVVQSEMKEGSTPAMALAVVQGGDLIVAKSYGLANLEHSVPATNATVFEIASLTKPFTATAVMMLVEKGEAELDDRITDHLPDLSNTWRAITLRHLFTHTSGLKNYEPLVSTALRPDDPLSRIVQAVCEQPLLFQPGEAFRYTNTNYVLLGLLIQQVSGRSYGEFVRDHIFAPLGMTRTRCNDPREIVPNRAQGYHWDSETLAHPGRAPLRNRAMPFPNLWSYADGGLLSTAVDLAKWDAALYTETLLKKATLDQMWTPARLNHGQPLECGLGWGVKDIQGHRLIGNWGRRPGFTAEMSRFVDDRLTVVVLCNRWKVYVGGLTRKIAGIYIPGFPTHH